MGAIYRCKDCAYFWKSKKNIGMPSNCPSCKSYNISYYTFGNVKNFLLVGVSGMLVFFIFPNEDILSVFKYAGLIIGLPILIVGIGMMVDGHYKNKRITKK